MSWSPPMSSALSATPSRSTSWGSDGESTTTDPSSRLGPSKMSRMAMSAPAAIAPGQAADAPAVGDHAAVAVELVGGGDALAVGVGERVDAVVLGPRGLGVERIVELVVGRLVVVLHRPHDTTPTASRRPSIRGG